MLIDSIKFFKEVLLNKCNFLSSVYSNVEFQKIETILDVRGNKSLTQDNTMLPHLINVVFIYKYIYIYIFI